MKKCIDGAKALELCKHGDQMIIQETGKVYKKEKNMSKGRLIYHIYIPTRNLVMKFLFQNCFVLGIGFPTCISVNNCVCHFSPLESEKDVILKNGDVVKMYDYNLLYKICHLIFMFSVLCLVI